MTCTELTSFENVETYQLVEDKSSKTIFIVQFDSSTLNVSCTCKKFESMGFLCSRSLKNLSIKNVKCILSQYILRRWVEDAKERI